MNEGRFDDIARWLGDAGRTRRNVSRRLAVAGFGVLLGGRGGDTAAECVKLGRACKRSGQCCGRAICRGRRCRRLHRTCLPYGEVCSSLDDACCADAHLHCDYGNCHCNAGFMPTSYDSGATCVPCLQLGESCEGTDTPCCIRVRDPGTCGRVSSTKGCIVTTGRTCCMAEGDDECRDDCDCCGDLLCGGGACRRCVLYGEPCALSDRCCDDVPCTDGRCRYP